MAFQTWAINSVAFHLQELDMYPCSPQIHKNKSSSVERAVFVCSALYSQNKHQSLRERERKRLIIRRTDKHQNNFTEHLLLKFNTLIHITTTSYIYNPLVLRVLGKENEFNILDSHISVRHITSAWLIMSHIYEHIICTRAQRSLMWRDAFDAKCTFCTDGFCISHLFHALMIIC